MTNAVETIIQAVSPEFNPSAATAEQKGIALKITVTSKIFDFILKTDPPLKLACLKRISSFPEKPVFQFRYPAAVP